MIFAGQQHLLRKNAAIGALALALAAVFACPVPAVAEDDPFQMDTSHWMSFDHYKDATKRGHIEAPPPPPADDNAPAATDQQTPAASQTSSIAPAIAAPTRPIDLPVMPGLNKGFGVQVTSTEDEKATQTAAPVISADAPPDIHLPVKNWQNPVTIHPQSVNADGDQENDNTPLDVRMTYLPDSKITPVPSPDHPSAQSLANAIALRGKVVKKQEDPKTPAQKAACEAIDAYKKQQLDAIQSDRQTLQALQSAISALGLQKQLDFIAGAGGTLNASGSASNAPDQKAPANMDMPAPTTVR